MDKDKKQAPVIDFKTRKTFDNKPEEEDKQFAEKELNNFIDLVTKLKDNKEITGLAAIITDKSGRHYQVTLYNSYITETLLIGLLAEFQTHLSIIRLNRQFVEGEDNE